MSYEGYVDTASTRAIGGWAFHSHRASDALTIEILSGSQVVATVKADVFRPDLVPVCNGNGNHGFKYQLPASAPDGPTLTARVEGKRWLLQNSGDGVNAPVHHDRRRTFLHSLEKGYPQVAAVFSAVPPESDEAPIVGRIIEAFHRAMRDDPAGAREPDLWQDIEGIYHREALKLLANRDVAGLSAYLRDAHAKGITTGITQGADATEKIRGTPAVTRSVATQFTDYLVSFAESLGMLYVECPEQRGEHGENLHTDPQVLVDRISAKLGFALETPPVMGSYFGVKTRDGQVSGRDLCAAYAALRMRDLAADFGEKQPAIVEIGGGMGGTAYYAAKLGMRYTIVDLPLVGVLQAYFLMKALPGVSIQLYGEEPVGTPAVRLLPTYRFGEPGSECAILFNQDSIPEMSPAYSLGYLRKAREFVRHAFYSINQEARAPQIIGQRQTVVHELVAQAGGFRRQLRYRHWMRPGYVEELYRVE